MPPTIVVSPNPVVRPTTGKVTANVYIGGLTPGTRYNIRVDATTIATARATREGSLAVGITVGTVSRLGGHAVDVRDSANVTTLAAGTFAVADAPPPPPPPPPPYEPPPTPARTTPPTIDREIAIPNPGADIQAWLATVPARSLLRAPAQAVYSFATSLRLNARTDLEFDWNGSLIRIDGWDLLDSAFHFGKSGGLAARIRIRNFTIAGDNPDGATPCAYHGQNGCAGGGESASGFQITTGPSDIEIVDGTIRDTWGHGAYVSSGAPGNPVPNRIWLHKLHILRAGVMGINFGVGRYLYAEDNVIDDTAIYPIDLEDGQSGEPLEHVYIGRNQLNRWGWNAHYTGHAIVGDLANGMKVDDITVEANVLMGGFQSPPANGQGGQIALTGTDLKTNVRVTNNRGVLGAGPLVDIQNTPGAVVTGNTQ